MSAWALLDVSVLLPRWAALHSVASGKSHYITLRRTQSLEAGGRAVPSPHQGTPGERAGSVPSPMRTKY
eukprot:scaffold80480_cov37-Tisochrysis_lutea.AAC.1